MAADRPEPRPSLAMGFAAIGSEMVGFTLFGVLIDYLTKAWPWATAGMTLLGLAVAMWHLSQWGKTFTKPGGTAT